MHFFNKLILIIPLTFFLTLPCLPQDSVPKSPYVYMPKAYEAWDYKIIAGLSLTKLPTQIVEEEINSSPSIFGNFRLGLPWDFSTGFYFASNYVSNIGTISLQYHIDIGVVNLSLGGSGSMWFGHVELESIKLKSYGFLWKPMVSAGMNIEGVLLTGSFEIQYGNMKTFSEDSLLAFFNQPESAYIFRFNAEQPLWNDNWIVLGVGLNYANFYYQSWLSYSAIKEYLLYPEFYFGFIF